ncbi:universal stress protein [Natrinema halophilum]|uniref:universal stress protein n=1 Tax=Natrinema halophilum TaxID=1699371 RepID=UPI001F2AB593|nr:universal stress protein [Natrinema halophilum]UHQ96366.1 universal stress protein [Natrinema halophilum]
MFRVLLPIDSDEERSAAAAEVVTSLPEAAETVHATILNVEEEMEVRNEAVVTSDEWYDEENFPSSLKRVRDVLEDAEITVEVQRRHANPAEAIVIVANEIDADRIVMGGRKRSPAGKALFGSVTQSVLLNSDTPVTVITK